MPWRIVRTAGIGLALGLAGCMGGARDGAPPEPVPVAPDTAPIAALAPSPEEAAEDGTLAAEAPPAPVAAAAGVPPGPAASTLRPKAAEDLLGRTIASLGDPADPGFWALTPLVDRPRAGRLVDPATGFSVMVDLRPKAADPGAGTQVSLPALRALGVPLTALPELAVYAAP